MGGDGGAPTSAPVHAATAVDDSPSSSGGGGGGLDYDVIIVGAGVAGCALAHALGGGEPGRASSAAVKQAFYGGGEGDMGSSSSSASASASSSTLTPGVGLRRRVALVERSWAEPDRIVGELLQPGGVQALATLGLHDLEQQRASSVVVDSQKDDAVADDADADDATPDDDAPPFDVLAELGATEAHGYAVLRCDDGSGDFSAEGKARMKAAAAAASSSSSSSLTVPTPLALPYPAVREYGMGRGLPEGALAAEGTAAQARRAAAIEHSSSDDASSSVPLCGPPVALPEGVPVGWSFHHGPFVSRLRKAALAAPGVTQIEGAATSLLEDDAGVVGVAYRDASTGDEVELRAPLTVVVDGFASNLRRRVGLPRPVVRSHFVGLILEDVPLPFPKHGNVFLTPDGPILAYQIGPREQRILVDVPDPLPSAKTGALHRYLLDVMTPYMRMHSPALADAFSTAVSATMPGGADDDGAAAAAAAVNPGHRLRTMPNSQLHPDPAVADRLGVLVLGDAFNMRHPLTGGGMTVCLNDVVTVRDLLAEVPTRTLDDRTAIRQALRPFHRARRRYSGTVNILAAALYSVFTFPPLMDACFAYFALGGRAVASPMALLAGIAQDPTLLIKHFFLVALLGVYRQLRGFPTPAKLANAIRLLNNATWIMVPLLRREQLYRKFAGLLAVVFALGRQKGQDDGNGPLVVKAKAD